MGKSLTYEFTLNFGENGTQQQKLNNQTVQCVKDSNGQWYIDETYTLPEAPSIDVDEGYTGGWKYRAKHREETIQWNKIKI